MLIKTFGSGSSGNCYLLQSGSSNLVLDAGIPFKKLQIGMKFKTSDINGVLVTHCHLDHAKYVKEYLNNGLEVYMTKGTKEALKLDNHYLLKTIKPLQMFKVDKFNIIAFESVHDAAEPVNFLIQINGNKLVYATDTKYIKYKFDGLTHLMIEANYDYEYMEQNVDDGVLHESLAKRIMNSHMSIDTAIDYLNKLDQSKLKEIHMIHLSETNSKHKEFKERLQRTTGAVVKIAKGEI